MLLRKSVTHRGYLGADRARPNGALGPRTLQANPAFVSITNQHQAITRWLATAPRPQFGAPGPRQPTARRLGPSSHQPRPSLSKFPKLKRPFSAPVRFGTEIERKAGPAPPPPAAEAPAASLASTEELPQASKDQNTILLSYHLKTANYGAACRLADAICFKAYSTTPHTVQKFFTALVAILSLLPPESQVASLIQQKALVFLKKQVEVPQIDKIPVQIPGIHYYNFMLEWAFVRKLPLARILALDSKLGEAVPVAHFTPETFSHRARVCLLKGDTTSAMEVFREGQRRLEGLKEPAPTVKDARFHILDRKPYYYLQMLTNLIKEHQLTLAESFVSEIPTEYLHTIPHFGTKLVELYSRTRNSLKGLEHLEALQKLPTFVPSPVLLTVLWDLCGFAGMFARGLEIHKDWVARHGVVPNANTFASIIEAAGRCNQPVFATAVMREILHWHLHERFRANSEKASFPIPDVKLVGTYLTQVVSLYPEAVNYQTWRRKFTEKDVKAPLNEEEIRALNTDVTSWAKLIGTVNPPTPHPGFAPR